MVAEFEFKIDGWTPATIPQERLGEYLVAVSKLYGEETSVQFRSLRKGSLVVVSSVAGPAIPKVQRRLVELRRGQAPRDTVETYRRLDDMLADDNAVGLLRGRGEDRGIIVPFPGRDRDRPIEYPGIREEGVLEGELIKIGGRDRTIHLALQSGDTVYSKIETDRDTARRLGPLIFGPTIRLFGMGTWRRGAEGSWNLDRFVVSSFVKMVDNSLADQLDDIRRIGGSEWHLEGDPAATLREIRFGIGSARK